MSLDPPRARPAAARAPEPAPEQDLPDAATDHTGDDQAGRGDTFVVQEHHARALHWDLRLERDGVLVSWAVPKGLPLDPATNHLAKQTEDHPLTHASVGRDVPRGEYGGGRVSVWDSGTYELQQWRPREVKVVLHGRRVQGRYVFIRTGGNDWLVHRMDGRPDGWLPVPQGLQPVRATAGPLPPDDERWSYEVSWQGGRVLVTVVGGRLRVADAAGDDLTARCPELRPMGLQLGSRQVLLDGELVVLDAVGRPDADLLARRTGVSKPGRALLREAPLQLLVQDLLHVEGTALLDRTHDERRAALDALGLHGPHWDVPPVFPRTGRAVLAAARGRGAPGVLAKRRTSPYRPGELTADWVVSTDPAAH